MRVLLLDQSYQPHRIISWRKAVLMLFGGKIEVLEEYEEQIRSVSTSIPAPAVVRLQRRVRGVKHRIRFSRRNVMLRDDYKCQYCGDRLHMKDLTYDHVVPRSRGGKTSWENIVTACRPCNGDKGDRTPAEAKMRLLKRPVKPTWLPFAASDLGGTGGEVPDLWKVWAPQLAA